MNKILAVVAVCLSCSGLVFADGSLLKLEVGDGILISPDISASQYSASFIDISTGGACFAAQYFYEKNKLLFGAEISRIQLYSVDLTNISYALSYLFDATTFLGLVGYELRVGKRFIPYLQAGLGMSMVRGETAGSQISNLVVTKNDLTILVGAGGMVGLGKRFFIDIFAKYYDIFTGGDDFATIAIGGGIGIRF